MKHHIDEPIALKKVNVKKDKTMTPNELLKADKDAAKLQSDNVRARFGLSPLKK